MTDPNIHDLDMIDTEYLACLAKGFDPVLDRNIIALFKERPGHSTIVQFLEIATKNTPLTDDEWNIWRLSGRSSVKKKGGQVQNSTDK